MDSPFLDLVTTILRPHRLLVTRQTDGTHATLRIGSADGGPHFVITDALPTCLSVGPIRSCQGFGPGYGLQIGNDIASAMATTWMTASTQT